MQNTPTLPTDQETIAVSAPAPSLPVKRGPGRPRLTEEQKKENAEKRKAARAAAALASQPEDAKVQTTSKAREGSKAPKTPGAAVKVPAGEEPREEATPRRKQRASKKTAAPKSVEEVYEEAGKKALVAYEVESGKTKSKGALGKIAPKAAVVEAPDDLVMARNQLRRLVAELDEKKNGVKRTKQRLGDIKRKDGTVLRCPFSAEQRDRMLALAKEEEKIVRTLETEIRRVLRRFPIYNLFLTKVFGVGVSTASRLVSMIDVADRPDKAYKISSLLRFAGLAVERGADGVSRAQRSKPGVKDDFSRKLKTSLYLAFDVIAKAARRDESPYYQRAVDYQHRLLSSPRYDAENNTFDGKKGGKGRVHNMRWRPAMQLFLEHYYIVARAIEGLGVWPSYEAAKLGYGHGGKVVVNAPKFLTVDEALALVGISPQTKEVPEPDHEPCLDDLDEEALRAIEDDL